MDNDLFKNIMDIVNENKPKDDFESKVKEYLQKFEVPVFEDEFKACSLFCKEMEKYFVPKFASYSESLAGEILRLINSNPDFAASLDYDKGYCLSELLRNEPVRNMSDYYEHALTYYVAQASIKGDKQLDSGMSKRISEISKKLFERRYDQECIQTLIEKGMEIGKSVSNTSQNSKDSDSKETYKEADSKGATKDSGDSKKAEDDVKITPEFFDFVAKYGPSYDYDKELEKINGLDPIFEKYASKRLEDKSLSNIEGSKVECILALFHKNKEDFFNSVVSCRVSILFENECNKDLDKFKEKLSNMKDLISDWMQNYCSYEQLNVIFEKITGKSMIFFYGNSKNNDVAQRNSKGAKSTNVNKVYPDVLERLGLSLSSYEFGDFRDAHEYFYNNFVLNFPNVDLESHIDYVKKNILKKTKVENEVAFLVPDFIKLDLARAAIRGDEYDYNNFYLALYLCERRAHFGEDYFEQVHDVYIDKLVKACRKSGTPTEDINKIIEDYFPGYGYKPTLEERIRAKVLRHKEERAYKEDMRNAKRAAKKKMNEDAAYSDQYSDDIDEFVAGMNNRSR